MKDSECKIGDLVTFTKVTKSGAYKVDNVLSCVLEAVYPPSFPPTVQDGGWLPISVKSIGLVIKNVGFRPTVGFGGRGRETLIVLFGDKLVYVDRWTVYDINF